MMPEQLNEIGTMGYSAEDIRLKCANYISYITTFLSIPLSFCHSMTQSSVTGFTSLAKPTTRAHLHFVAMEETTRPAANRKGKPRVGHRLRGLLTATEIRELQYNNGTVTINRERSEIAEVYVSAMRSSFQFSFSLT